MLKLFNLFMLNLPAHSHFALVESFRILQVRLLRDVFLAPRNIYPESNRANIVAKMSVRHCTSSESKNALRNFDERQLLQFHATPQSIVPQGMKGFPTPTIDKAQYHLVPYKIRLRH